MTHPITRRSALVALIGTTAAAPATAGELVQPERPGPEAFAARAFTLRDQAVEDGDQPYGAVVVLDGRIIGEAASRVVVNRDPTAHAEMEAIRDALRRRGIGDLTGAILYSSSRPCPMCEAAASYAGIARMVHGRSRTDAGAPRLTRC